MLLIKLFSLGQCPHFCPEKRDFLILPAHLVLLFLDFDPFLLILTHANSHVLLSDPSNAGHLFGTNVLWLNWISFTFLHATGSYSRASPPTDRASHFGMDFIFPSKSLVPFTPRLLVTQWIRYSDSG